MNDQLRMRRILWIGGLGSVLLLAVYVWIYTAVPFSGFINPAAEITWNDFWVNLLTVLAAAFSAVTATLVLRCYERKEPLHLVWLSFAIGLWIWCAAELTWMVYNLAMGEVPNPSLADLFWVIAYVFFTIAFVRQYAMIYRPSQRKRFLVGCLGWLAILLLTLVIALLPLKFDFGSLTLSSLVNIFYPVADFAIAVGSLYFIINFRRGAMTRPWLGLFAFAVADSVYAWLYESGMYTFSTLNENTVSAVSDTVYVAAYLILAMGLLMHFLLVRYGPLTLTSPKLDAAAKSSTN